MSRFDKVLKDVYYKGWRFLVGGEGTGHWYMQVEFAAQDNPSGPVKVHKGRKWWLSEHMTDSEIVQTALKAVLTAEEHEAREQFLYAGRAIFGPHIDVKALWYQCGKTDERK